MLQSGICLSKGSLPQSLQAASTCVLQQPVQGNPVHLSRSVPQRILRQLVLRLCTLQRCIMITTTAHRLSIMETCG